MTAALSFPYTPIPEQDVVVTVSATVGNYVEVWCTAAPSESKVQAKIDEDESQRYLLHAGFTAELWRTSFDAGGRYVVSLIEYTKGTTTHGGDWEQSADGHQTVAQLSTTSATIDVLKRLTCRVGVNTDQATLVLYVSNTSIVATTKQNQGEATPSLIEPTSDRIRNAIEVDAIVTPTTGALALLVGTATTIAGDAEAVFSDICTQYEGHRTFVSHAASDTDNTINSSYQNASNLEEMSQAVGFLQQTLRQHFLNDSGTGPGSASSEYHTLPDWDNLPIADTGGDAFSNYVAISDCWRAYETHRMDTSVHEEADIINDCAALPALMNLHRLILHELSQTTPTAVSTEHTAALALRTRAGMTWQG